MPLLLDWTGLFKVNDDTNFKLKLHHSSNTSFGVSWAQNLNKNLKVVISNESVVRGSDASHNYGVQLKYE